MWVCCFLHPLSSRLCEITPQEPLTAIDTDLYDELDAMDNLGMPIIDEDDLDRAFDFEYEVSYHIQSLEMEITRYFMQCPLFA